MVKIQGFGDFLHLSPSTFQIYPWLWPARSFPLKPKIWLHFHSLAKRDFSGNPLEFKRAVLFFPPLGERLKSPLKIMPGGYFSLIPFRETWKHMALEAQRVLMKQSAAVPLCRLHPERASERASERSHPAWISLLSRKQFRRNPIKAQWASVGSGDGQPLKDRSCWKGCVSSQVSVARQTNPVNL